MGTTTQARQPLRGPARFVPETGSAIEVSGPHTGALGRRVSIMFYRPGQPFDARLEIFFADDRTLRDLIADLSARLPDMHKR